MSAEPRAAARLRAEEDYVAMIAHELRSPLNGIKAWAHVLRNSVAVDAAAERAIDGILVGVAEQVRLVQGLADISSARAGTLELTRHPLVLAEALAEAAHEAMAAAQAKSVRLAIDNTDSDATVNADGARVRELLTQALLYAIRYCPAGSTVRATASRDRDMACVEVADDGAPAAARHCTIGLALAQELAALHGGNVRVEGGDREVRIRVRLPRT